MKHNCDHKMCTISKLYNLPSTPVRKKLSIPNESCTAAAALAVNGLIVVAIKEAAVTNVVSIISLRVDCACNDVAP